jgi:hypothetical protein
MGGIIPECRESPGPKGIIWGQGSCQGPSSCWGACPGAYQVHGASHGPWVSHVGPRTHGSARSWDPHSQLLSQLSRGPHHNLKPGGDVLVVLSCCSCCCDDSGSCTCMGIWGDPGSRGGSGKVSEGPPFMGRPLGEVGLGSQEAEGVWAGGPHGA